MASVRFPSVPQADDPELAGYALWNDEIAEDLEALDALFAAQEARLRAQGFTGCPCGAVTMRRLFRCPCGAARCGEQRESPTGADELSPAPESAEVNPDVAP
jgi:hypothetical protein